MQEKLHFWRPSFIKLQVQDLESLMHYFSGDNLGVKITVAWVLTVARKIDLAIFSYKFKQAVQPPCLGLIMVPYAIYVKW